MRSEYFVCYSDYFDVVSVVAINNSADQFAHKHHIRSCFLLLSANLQQGKAYDLVNRKRLRLGGEIRLLHSWRAGSLNW